jgi:cell division protein FtsB
MIEKIKKNYFVIFGTFLFLYFFFNLLDGERGLISLLKKGNLLSYLKLEEKKIKEKIDNLEFKNSLLSNNLDTDYVEILIREKFIYSKKGEKIYVLKDEN